MNTVHKHTEKHTATQTHCHSYIFTLHDKQVQHNHKHTNIYNNHTGIITQQPRLHAHTIKIQAHTIKTLSYTQ